MALGIIQDLTFETDSRRLFARMLRSAIRLSGCLVVKPVEGREDRDTSQHPSLATVRAWSLDQDDGVPPWPQIHLLICQLHPQQRALWVPAKDGPNLPRHEIDATIREVLGLITKDKIRTFVKTCRQPFRGFEGNLEIGYRLHLSGGHAPLDIALCTVFYGK